MSSPRYGPTFETDEHRKHEVEFYDLFTKITGLKADKESKFSYCDGDVRNWRGVCAVTEFRWRKNSRNRYPTFWISGKKVFHGIERAAQFKAPFFYFVEWEEGYFYYRFVPEVALRLEWTWGGHSKSKMRYEYDREWGININPDDFRAFVEGNLFDWVCLAAGAVTDNYSENEVDELRKMVRKEPPRE